MIEIIKPEIEVSLKKEIRYGAIVMALKRLSSELEFRTTYKIVKVIREIGDITVRSSLVDYNFKVTRYRYEDFRLWTSFHYYSCRP